MPARRLPSQAHPCNLSRIILTLLCTIITIFFASAQPVFSPAADDDVLLKAISKNYEDHYKKALATLPKENKKDFEDIFRERVMVVKALIDEKEVYTSAPARQYLDALVAEIGVANPLLQKQTFNCYFSRSGAPNASYIGGGVILFNMGLFRRLTNESQAAFILCHEIAHFYLQHSENSIRRYVYAINADDMQKGLRKITRTEYGKRQQFENLVKNFTFDIRRHSRDHESEADSMAMYLMHNTRYDVSEALTALALLDSIDTDTSNMGVRLQKTFDAQDYPFQQKWLAKHEGLLGGHARLKQDLSLADSLKTHPDCKMRIKLLEPFVSAHYNSSALKNVVSEVTFNEIEATFSYEIIQFAYASQNYTRSLYYTLELLQNNPNDPYLVAQAGKIFNGFYDAQKAHTLGRLIDLPAPHYPANYNVLLQFIQNLYLEDFSLVSYHFLKKYAGLLAYYLPFTEAYAKAKLTVEQY